MTTISEYIQPYNVPTQIIGAAKVEQMQKFKPIVVGKYIIPLKYIFIPMIIILIMIIIIILFTVSKDDKKDSFTTDELQNDVDDLTKYGWEVYVTPTCPYCIKQKEILSQHFPTFNSIYTDRPVNVVPTWFNTKTQQKVEGMQTYEGLLNMIKNSSNVSTENTDPLSRCGWELYVTPTCPYCIRQKEILAEIFPTFDKIYTDRPVNVVPTWFNTKTQQKLEGMQTKETILNMANC